MALQKHPTFPYLSPSNHVRMILGPFHFEKHPAELGFVHASPCVWTSKHLHIHYLLVARYLEMRHHNWNSLQLTNILKTNRNTGPHWGPFQRPVLSPTAFVAFDLPMTLDGAADANWVVTLWELRGKFACIGKVPCIGKENPPCSSSLSIFKGFSSWQTYAHCPP